jgi:hypothetical protein
MSNPGAQRAGEALVGVLAAPHDPNHTDPAAEGRLQFPLLLRRYGEKKKRGVRYRAKQGAQWTIRVCKQSKSQVCFWTLSPKREPLPPSHDVPARIKLLKPSRSYTCQSGAEWRGDGWELSALQTQREESVFLSFRGQFQPLFGTKREREVSIPVSLLERRERVCVCVWRERERVCVRNRYARHCSIFLPFSFLRGVFFFISTLPLASSMVMCLRREAHS